jgi:hypothetical protein
MGAGMNDPDEDEENMEEMTLDQATAAAAVKAAGINGTNKAKKKKKGKRRRSSARFLNLDSQDDEVSGPNEAPASRDSTKYRHIRSVQTHKPNTLTIKPNLTPKFEPLPPQPPSQDSPSSDKLGENGRE